MQPCFQTPHNDCEAKSLEQGWTGTQYLPILLYACRSTQTRVEETVRQLTQVTLHLNANSPINLPIFLLAIHEYFVLPCRLSPSESQENLAMITSESDRIKSFQMCLPCGNELSGKFKPNLQRAWSLPKRRKKKREGKRSGLHNHGRIATYLHHSTVLFSLI